jgi:hypothetical protein
MTRSFLRNTVALVLGAAALAAPAAAGDFTVYAGRVKPGSLTLANVRTSLDGSSTWGFRLAHGFLPVVGLEHTVGFSRDFARRSDVAGAQDVNGFVYNSNLIDHVPIGRTVPYATVGLGFIRQYGSDQVIGTKFAVNYGGGVKFKRLLGPLGLRVDVRGYSASGVISGRLNIFEVSGGLLLGF